MDYKISLTCVVLLSACGGGGGGSSQVTQNATLREIGTRIDAFRAIPEMEDDGSIILEPIEFDDIPTSGTANYSGYADVTIDGQVERVAVGFAELTANFEDGEIAGTADNFVEVGNLQTRDFDQFTGENIDGALSYEFMPSESWPGTFEGSVTGAVTWTDDTTLDVDDTLRGYFVAGDGELFWGRSEDRDKPLKVSISTVRVD